MTSSPVPYMTGRVPCAPEALPQAMSWLGAALGHRYYGSRGYRGFTPFCAPFCRNATMKDAGDTRAMPPHDAAQFVAASLSAALFVALWACFLPLYTFFWWLPVSIVVTEGLSLIHI